MITQYGQRYFNDVDGDVWDDEPETEPTYNCGKCGRGIYEGEEFYRIDNLEYCRACARHTSSDILKAHGGEGRVIKLPICDFCKSEIQGKYVRYGGERFCEDCLTDFGEEILEDVFCVKPETAEPPDKR